MSYRCAVLGLLLLSACASGPPRPEWTRGPLTDASLEFKRDHYQCQQESRVVAYPPASDPDPYGRPGFGRGFAAGAYAGAMGRVQREAKALYKDCLRARGWSDKEPRAFHAAHFGDRDHGDRFMVISSIGDHDRSGATLGVGG